MTAWEEAREEGLAALSAFRKCATEEKEAAVEAMRQAGKHS